MTKIKKNEVISYLSEEFKNSGAVVVANYKGSSHKNLESLRQEAFSNDVKVKITKNTLANVAFKTASLPELTLEEESIFIWAEDQIAACKLAEKFASTNKETFVIKTGIIDGEIADVNKINAFAKLPGREELLGMLASVWMGPVRNFTIGLDALRIKKEEAA